MGHLVEESLVVRLRSPEGLLSWHPDDILSGRVDRRKSRVVDGADLGLLHDLGGLFKRVKMILNNCLSLGRWRDPLGLVQVEGVAPADEGNPGRASIASEDEVSLVIPLFKKLVVDDRGGVLTLLDLPSEVMSLFEGQPVGGLKFTPSQDEGVDPPVGFLGDDILDSHPGFLPWNGSFLELVDKAGRDELVDVLAHSATSSRAWTRWRRAS